MEWREEASAVFQDYVRFEITARDNIIFGDLERRDDRPAMELAAAKSGAAEMIATLPGGFDTMLGRAFDETGQDISSGQWQRLASARAYFRDASVLVLDEPTAALDARAEVDVYRRFRETLPGKDRPVHLPPAWIRTVGRPHTLPRRGSDCRGWDASRAARFGGQVLPYLLSAGGVVPLIRVTPELNPMGLMRCSLNAVCSWHAVQREFRCRWMTWLNNPLPKTPVAWYQRQSS